MNRRPLTPPERILIGVDRVLRTLYGTPRGTGRPNPALAEKSRPPQETAAQQRIGRLMRVNLAGEVAAQALYHGQSITARKADVAERLHRAADEENDHLIWCRERLAVLDTRPSLLNPFWYAGSFAIGALAGLIGDAESLGFLEETERQVVEHLSRHLKHVPAEDTASRALLARMREDEARHGLNAHAAGAKRPPTAVRLGMKFASRVMTGTAYWI
ncbi:MAG: 2-polyprenyl-3-methyl-6-methoxy-1,4-benzoquinone monooxygenase [Gammaproteobacteria bacterium]